jgi:AAA ATPase domain
MEQQSPRQPERLADTLAAAGRRRFIGRSAELAAFEASLEHSEPVSVLWLSGPGGVGKTALMQAWADQAQRAGWRTVRVDGRAVGLSGQAFAAAVESAVVADRSLPQADGTGATGLAVFIDTYERLEPLDGWLREQYLPSLPTQTLITIASRQLPGVEWRTDPGWAAVLEVLPLRNFRPEESRAYLTSRGVPEPLQADALGFTHGNPLALSLLTDLYRLQPERFTVHHPDVIQTLVRRLLDDVPTPLHRRALEVCAHLRVTTEDRLAEALMINDASELFEWLRSLSFIESGPTGVFPHDLTRDVIEADLRWRSPERYRQLHDDVRRGIVRQLQHGTLAERKSAFSDLLFLHRYNPIMHPLYQWDMLGQAAPSPAGPDDHDLLVEIVRRQEGSASADIMRHWLRRQPDGFWLFRDATGDMLGFTCMLELGATTDQDRHLDPAVAAARRFIAEFGPVRSDEAVLYCRWTLSRTTPVPSDTPGLWEPICMINVIHWLSTPRLSWSFVTIEDPDRWLPFFTHIRQQHAPQADFSVGGRRYAVFVHDWRAEPPLTWLQEMADRELTTAPLDDRDDRELLKPVVVLSHPEFEAAVRQALRDYARPDRLANNALLSSRLVTDRAEDQSPSETLRRLVRHSAEELNTHPRDQRLYRALYRTFLNPAASQERAADLLGLPFSTYRAHLRAGTKRVTELLWQRELYGAEGLPPSLNAH